MQHLHNPDDTVHVTPDATLAEAAALLRERGIGSLVVTDAAGRAVGIVTDRDLCLRAVAFERDPHRARVSEVMTPEVRGAQVTGSVATVDCAWAEPMRRLGVRRVPLLDVEGRPVGLFSSDDWLRWLAERIYEVAATTDPARRHGPLRPAAVALDELTLHLEARQLLDRDELLEAIGRLRKAL